MIALIDNYDSFSYNLYQLAGSLREDIAVYRNDALTVAELDSLAPDAIIISPGPGRPEDAGICVGVIRELGGKYPILGVCLGHQAICAAYGASVSYAKRLMHGRQSRAAFDPGCPLFAGLPPAIDVARYHSLAAVKETLPDCLTVTALVAADADGTSPPDAGEIMAVSHRDYKVYGLQFHPESILTPDGRTIITNFFGLIK